MRVQGCTLPLPLPNNASRWQRGFNSPFKGLKLNLSVVFPTDNLQWIILLSFIVLILCVVLVLNLNGFPCTEFVVHNFLADAFQNTFVSYQGLFI